MVLFYLPLYESILMYSLMDLAIKHNWLEYCLLKTQDGVLLRY